MQVPPFPADGPLRPLAMGATLALLGFLTAFVATAAKRDRSGAAWTAAVLAGTALTIVLGTRGSDLHTAAAVLTAAVAVRNVWRVESNVARVATALGVAGWFVSLISARILFG